jgi:hypothetical protein
VVGLNQEEGHASPIEELSQIPESQLEEDVGSTFCNQFKGVAYKFWLVLFPVGAEQKVSYLRNWDLWGPFLMAVAFLLIIGSTLLAIQPTTSSWRYSTRCSWGQEW